MMDYPRASDSYIQQVLNKDIYEQVYTLCYNLSCILGDVDGKVYTGLMTRVLAGLEIVNPGVLVLGEDTKGIEGLIIEESYDTQTSQSGYSTYLLLRNSNPNIVTTLNYLVDFTPDSLLVRYSEDMAPYIRNAINALYVECLALYRELLVSSLDAPLSMTLEDVKRLISNIRWLSGRLEAQDSPNYDLIEALRDTQVTLMYTLSIPDMFSTKESDKMRELLNMSDSVVSVTDGYTLKEYTVQQGDTIHSVAQRMLGDASKAIDLITFNDLEYPFIDSTAMESKSGVKRMGDVILVPTFEAVTMGTNQDLSYLGGDIRLVDRDLSGGDFEVDTYGDLMVVEGIDCLTQDLKTRLGVEIGGLLYHPTYGNGLLGLIGNKGDQDRRQKVEIEAHKVLTSDNRILSVDSLTIFESGAQVTIDATLVVRGYSGTVPFNYNFNGEV